MHGASRKGERQIIADKSINSDDSEYRKVGDSDQEFENEVVE